MLSDRKWKTIEGTPVPDVVAFLRETLADGDPREIHIGTDSQNAGPTTEFVTVLAVLKPGKGGRAVYARERSPRVRSLRERLMREVWMSVSLGLEIEAVVPERVGMTIATPTIHVDANPDVRFRSSDYVKELTAMVVSQGFNALLKPDSWVATHVADHTVKSKVLRM